MTHPKPHSQASTVAESRPRRHTNDGTPFRPAGELSAWVAGVLASIRRDAASDVPCDGCTACCRSSQFIHVTPADADAVAHIPSALLFPAPGLPAGHYVLGYDERGHCPMLVDDRCSIYEHRPTTCRTYDCRVFAATGIDVAEEKPLVAERVREWRFDESAADDERTGAAIMTAAAYLAEHRGELADGDVPANPTQRAVLVIDIHDVFVTDPAPTPQTVSVAISRRRSRGYGRDDADAGV